MVEEEEEEDEEEEVGCCGVRSQVLEELIPLRPVVSCDGAEKKRGSGEASEKKTEWLKSVKLWTQDAVLSKDVSFREEIDGWSLFGVFFFFNICWF